LTPITTEARILQDRLDKALAYFRGEARPWLLDGHSPTVCNEALRGRRERLLDRFRSAVEPGTLECLRILGRLADGSHEMFSVFTGGDK
jgi:hypothetical protein